MTLKAITFNGTLKSSGGDPSSTDRLLALIADGLKKHGINTDVIRLADHNVLPGVTSDEGDGDAWPAIREKLLAADILIVGTPIWMARRHPSPSVRLSAWMLSCRKPTIRVEWSPMAEWRR